MDINDLVCFIEITKDLNMTAAAKRLFISQQALSLKIQRLERQYGVQLFERHPKLKLTYAGEIFLDGAQAILQENQALIAHLADVSINHSAILRLGIPSSRAAVYLPSTLCKFKRRWPNVTFQMADEPTPDLLSAVEQGGLDLAVVVPTRSDLAAFREKIIFTPMMNERMYLVASHELLERYFGEKVSDVIESASKGTDLRTFQPLPFILHKHPLNLRKIADDTFQKAGYKPNIYVEADNTETILSMYPCHLGLFFCRGTRIPTLMAQFSGCHAFPLMWEGVFIGSDIYLARSRRRRFPQYIKDFSDLIQEMSDQFQI